MESMPLPNFHRIDHMVHFYAECKRWPLLENPEWDEKIYIYIYIMNQNLLMSIVWTLKIRTFWNSISVFYYELRFEWEETREQSAKIKEHFSLCVYALRTMYAFAITRFKHIITNTVEKMYTKKNVVHRIFFYIYSLLNLSYWMRM